MAVLDRTFLVVTGVMTAVTASSAAWSDEPYRVPDALTRQAQLPESMQARPALALSLERGDSARRPPEPRHRAVSRTVRSRAAPDRRAVGEVVRASRPRAATAPATRRRRRSSLCSRTAIKRCRSTPREATGSSASRRRSSRRPSCRLGYSVHAIPHATRPERPAGLQRGAQLHAHAAAAEEVRLRSRRAASKTCCARVSIRTAPGRTRERHSSRL